MGHLTRKSEVLGLIPDLATFISPSADSKGAVVSYWRKYVHKVLVNGLGGLNLPRKSVVRLTDCPDMTLDVYRGRKTTTQQQQQSHTLRISTDNFFFTGETFYLEHRFSDIESKLILF